MKTAREKSAKLKEKEKAQVESAGAAEGGEKEDTAPGEKRGLEESTESTNSKKPRLDNDASPPADDAVPSTTKPDSHAPRVRDQSKIEHLQSLLSAQPPTRSTPQWTEPDPYPSSLILTKPASEMRGHTSYLTFATLHPLSIRTEVAPVAKTRVDILKEEMEVASPTEGGSEYGSEGLEEVMRTMTEEEMMSLAAV